MRENEKVNGMSYEYARALYIASYGGFKNSEGIPIYNGWSTDASVPASLTDAVFIGVFNWHYGSGSLDQAQIILSTSRTARTL